MSAAERRAEILDAALEEFSKRGFHETSLEGVAERAGVSKALIYEHFASKRELHEALIDTYVHEMLEGLIAAVGTADPPEVRLRAGADAFLAFVERNREPWRLIIRNPTAAGLDEPIAGVHLQLGHAMAAMMRADAPQIYDAHPEEADFVVEMVGQQLVGSLRALANWWDENREVPREQILRALMDFAWVGLDRLKDGERWSA